MPLAEEEAGKLMTAYSCAVHVEVLYKLMFMKRPAWQIQYAETDQSVAGANQKWC